MFSKSCSPWNFDTDTCIDCLFFKHAKKTQKISARCNQELELCQIWWLSLHFLKFHHVLISPFYATGLFLYPLKTAKGVCNPGQGIWNRLEKSSKTGREKKGLILTLACFRLLLLKFNLWKGDLTLGYVSAQIWEFSNIP